MSCNTSSKPIAADALRDTVILYTTDRIVLTPGPQPSVKPINLTLLQSRPSFDKDIKTILVLTNPDIITRPDGVYELYITDSLKREPGKLIASSSVFISLLDLYSFTAPGAKQQIEIDITGSLKKIYPGTMYIGLQFDPVKLADGTYSSNAGEIGFDELHILQVKTKQ